MCKNDAFDAKIVKTRLTKIFIASFAPDERLPSSATLFVGSVFLRNVPYFGVFQASQVAGNTCDKSLGSKICTAIQDKGCNKRLQI